MPPSLFWFPTTAAWPGTAREASGTSPILPAVSSGAGGVTGGVRGGRAQVVPRMVRRGLLQTLRRGVGSRDVAGGQMHVHRCRPERTCSCARRVHLLQCTFEDVGGALRFTA